jgi:hypothetical protein
MAVALNIAERIYDSYGADCVVTSCSEGHSKHGFGSLHYQGGAVDLRTRNLPTTEVKEAVALALRGSLSSDFDVILESVGTPNEHIHVEFQPKG